MYIHAVTGVGDVISIDCLRTGRRSLAEGNDGDIRADGVCGPAERFLLELSLSLVTVLRLGIIPAAGHVPGGKQSGISAGTDDSAPKRSRFERRIRCVSEPPVRPRRRLDVHPHRRHQLVPTRLRRTKTQLIERGSELGKSRPNSGILDASPHVACLLLCELGSDDEKRLGSLLRADAGCDYTITDAGEGKLAVRRGCDHPVDRPAEEVGTLSHTGNPRIITRQIMKKRTNHALEATAFCDRSGAWPHADHG